jgi:CxxC motif-containing protein
MTSKITLFHQNFLFICVISPFICILHANCSINRIQDGGRHRPRRWDWMVGGSQFTARIVSDVVDWEGLWNMDQEKHREPISQRGSTKTPKSTCLLLYRLFCSVVIHIIMSENDNILQFASISVALSQKRLFFNDKHFMAWQWSLSWACQKKTLSPNPYFKW